MWDVKDNSGLDPGLCPDSSEGKNRSDHLDEDRPRSRKHPAARSHPWLDELSPTMVSWQDLMSISIKFDSLISYHFNGVSVLVKVYSGRFRDFRSPS